MYPGFKSFQLSKAGPTKINEIPQTVREDLECTICLEISVSPIQGCVNGHLVCAICFEKVKTCGLCKEPLQICGLAERLARKYEIKVTCKNEAAGCTVIPNSFDVMAHLPECEYRPIQCFEKYNADCNGQYFHFNEFYKHLTDIHRRVQIHQNSKTGNHSITFCTNNLNPRTTVYYPVNCLEYQDIFLIHSANNEFGVFYWITVIGGREKAKMYKFILTLVSPAKIQEYEMVEYRWTLPVLPVRNNHNLANITKTGCFASIHPDALQPFCKEKEGLKYKYNWTIELELVNLPCATQFGWMTLENVKFEF